MVKKVVVLTRPTLARIFTHPAQRLRRNRFPRDAPFRNLGRTDARTKLGGMCVLTHMGRAGEKSAFSTACPRALY
jgi:hypothetical protein